MTTRRAVSHLNALLELVDRADAMARGLAATFSQVVEQIDAVLNDADRTVSQVLVEEATGQEVAFSLTHAPIQAESLQVLVGNSPLSADQYSVDSNSGAGTWLTPLPVGSHVLADYVALGLRSQMEPLATAMGIHEDQVLSRRAHYLQAIEWLRANFN